jgi:hypothetical protein
MTYDFRMKFMIYDFRFLRKTRDVRQKKLFVDRHFYNSIVNLKSSIRKF